MDLSQFENQNINRLINYCLLFFWGGIQFVFNKMYNRNPMHVYMHLLLFIFIYRFCCLDATAAAQTIMFAAVDESLNAVTGKYVGHCQYAIENRLVHDASACQRLWDYSLKMCDLY